MPLFSGATYPPPSVYFFCDFHPNVVCSRGLAAGGTNVDAPCVPTTFHPPISCCVQLIGFFWMMSNGGAMTMALIGCDDGLHHDRFNLQESEWDGFFFFFFFRHVGLPPKTHNHCASARFLEGLLQYLQFQKTEQIWGAMHCPFGTIGHKKVCFEKETRQAFPCRLTVSDEAYM